jgi:hypothetical protein
MDEEVSNLLKRAGAGKIADIISAIVQVVAAMADRAQRRVTCGRS